MSLASWRDRLDQRLAEGRLAEHLRIQARDAEEALGLAPHDCRERLEHGRHQHRTERVRLEVGS